MKEHFLDTLDALIGVAGVVGEIILCLMLLAVVVAVSISVAYCAWQVIS